MKKRRFVKIVTKFLRFASKLSRVRFGDIVTFEVTSIVMSGDVDISHCDVSKRRVVTTAQNSLNEVTILKTVTM